MLTRRPFLAALGAGAIAFPARADERVALDGVWTGVLDAGAQRLRLRFEIGRDGRGTLRSLDQGGAPIPVEITYSRPDRVTIEAPSIRGVFAGTAQNTGRVDGVWRQGGGAIPLVLFSGEAGLASRAKDAPLDLAGLRALRLEGGPPALTAACSHRNGSIRRWTDGERAAGSGVRATDDDLWHVGSITKSMTATLVARLVESGAVAWSDTVGETLVAIAPDMRAEYRAISYRHLLSHRAGLQPNIPVPSMLRYARSNPDPREERRAFAREVLAMAPKGPMGATFEYANNGYVIAGAMLEARLGQPWEALMRAHIFGPLAMASAGFGAPGVAGRLDQPAGHTKALFGDARKAHLVGERLTDNVAALGPAGTVHASAADMLRYLAAHRDRTSLLGAESWSLLHTPPFGGDYAMGWVRRADETLWHNGSNTLWYAEVAIVPATGVAAFAAANDGYMPKAQPAVGRALRGAIAAA
jgi:CubicO group peptidase (beta-lactamase class C family)